MKGFDEWVSHDPSQDFVCPFGEDCENCKYAGEDDTCDYEGQDGDYKKGEKTKFTVMGHTIVTISVEVEADNRKDAIDVAYNKFGGILAFCGNGGTDKLIGVYGGNETIAADDEIVFDDVL